MWLLTLVVRYQPGVCVGALGAGNVPDAVHHQKKFQESKESTFSDEGCGRVFFPCGNEEAVETLAGESDAILHRAQNVIQQGCSGICPLQFFWRTWKVAEGGVGANKGSEEMRGSSPGRERVEL